MGVKDVVVNLENMRKEELVKFEECYQVEIFELNFGWESKVVSI